LPQEEKAYENLYFVNFGFVNVRKEPNVKSEKLGEIPGQAFVRPLSVDPSWAKVMVDGKEGYVSMQFISPFKPQFIVRQSSFRLPILHYNVDQPGMLEAMKAHVQALRQNGARFVTLRDFYDLLLVQQETDRQLQEKSVVIAVSGATPETVRDISLALQTLGARATLFVQTRHVGISGISEKELLTLQANGFDVQSGAHTGDDLRGLTNAQLKLELAQSRALLEETTRRTVFAVAYPMGGVNDRVMERAADSGYLFGVGGATDTKFSRDQMLRMPHITIAASMTADDIVQLVK
jgi:hypothetical protein